MPHNQKYFPQPLHFIPRGKCKGTPCSLWWALDFFSTCFILVSTSAPHILYNTQNDFLKCVSDHTTPLQWLPTEHKVKAQVLIVAPKVLNHMVWSCFWPVTSPSFPTVQPCQALPYLSVFTSTFPFLPGLFALLSKRLGPSHSIISSNTASSKRPSTSPLSLICVSSNHTLSYYYFYFYSTKYY